MPIDGIFNFSLLFLISFQRDLLNIELLSSDWKKKKKKKQVYYQARPYFPEHHFSSLVSPFFSLQWMKTIHHIFSSATKISRHHPAQHRLHVHQVTLNLGVFGFWVWRFWIKKLVSEECDVMKHVCVCVCVCVCAHVLVCIGLIKNELKNRFKQSCELKLAFFELFSP